jgi:hypothetical protein
MHCDNILRKKLQFYYKIIYTKQTRSFAWSPCLQLLKYKLSQRQDLFMIYSRAEFNVFSSTESLTLINTLKADEHFYTTRDMLFLYYTKC